MPIDEHEIPAITYGLTDMSDSALAEHIETLKRQIAASQTALSDARAEQRRRRDPAVFKYSGRGGRVEF